MQPNDSTNARKVRVTVRTYTPQGETSRRVQDVNTTRNYLEFRATSPHIEGIESTLPARLPASLTRSRATESLPKRISGGTSPQTIPSA